MVINKDDAIDLMSGMKTYAYEHFVVGPPRPFGHSVYELSRTKDRQPEAGLIDFFNLYHHHFN